MSILTMKPLKKWLTILMLALVIPTYAVAQDTYRMIGAAQFERGSDFHRLSFPVNPVMAGSLTFDSNTFVYHETGNSCSVKVDKRVSFYVDPIISRSFGSFDNFNSFLSRKFHAKASTFTDTFVLSAADAPLCEGLRYATIYKSPDEIVLLDGSWAYLFERQTHAPVNAEESFDCKKAATNVEHLICNNPELAKLDATVSRGYVGMLLTDSKEISYEDPVRNGQLDWLRNVRNKCENPACLFAAYSSRIRFIKSRISSAYPSYPAQEPDQDGD
ncbi:hypothetical protein E2553_08680 [Paraburkholderia dipogonis]|uniref:PF07007 family protein n=1 Tax=Paraburkholderia dipogonis TaxID=1211383 RepID=A0A4Y8N6P8_9BURK|nr:hypothetical protein [Paraburkholderia dipogonis]TFE45088.1 hypothetical protein E2553_08680 [Paraburkholderia dipogonis]